MVRVISECMADALIVLGNKEIRDQLINEMGTRLFQEAYDNNALTLNYKIDPTNSTIRYTLEGYILNKDETLKATDILLNKLKDVAPEHIEYVKDLRSILFNKSIK